jgi:hypothetical protein
MQHEPCGLLGNAQIAGNLVTADAIFAVGEQPSCGKPLVQTDGRVLKNSSNLDRELALWMMLCTLPSAPLCIELANAIGAASRANDAIRPATRSKVFNAVVQTGEVLDGF